jgi:hypothetical protein
MTLVIGYVAQLPLLAAAVAMPRGFFFETTPLSQRWLLLKEENKMKRPMSSEA